MGKAKLSLVIPAFNEADNIGPFLDRCETVFSEYDAELEYIFVDDGSSDGTFDKVQTAAERRDDWAKTDCTVRGISFSRNFGKESAILAGMKAATGDYICFIDADLQQDPKYALEMALFLEQHEDYECVACYQEERKESAVLRFFKGMFYRLINRISDTRFEENASDFRTIRREVAEAILSMPEYNRFSKGIFAWVGFRTHFMPYEVSERLHGESSWSFKKLTGYAIDGFVGFSTAPLKAASWVGGFVSGIALIYLIVVIVQRIVTAAPVPGYATIVSLLLIIGGLQLLFLGIIGEYLARMYLEVKHRPVYIVHREISSKEKR